MSRALIIYGLAISVGLLAGFTKLSCRKASMERISGHPISWYDAWMTESK